MAENKYMSYEEGFDKLCEDLKLPMEDPAQRKAFMIGWLNTVITN